MKSTLRHRDEHVLSPIAWALIELDEIGYHVEGNRDASMRRWQVDLGPPLTSRQVISFAIEATAHASSRRHH
ncbi:hypothetical protein [Methylobacterium sp. B4]|uniref:hypothetical protein n=1 Tax=Methylobacterium sp. B4 TaxID=1938755 RepID=UPI000D76101B|nr:hypothetical protein [Methylobacterium sp. B4]PXW50213.1 hypothetical protein BY998_1479 [Methylobacterium sp. B4]